MPRAYTWFMVFVTDQNHIEGFQKKKKKVLNIISCKPLDTVFIVY